jgi:predicted MFS family arabinose efflux permease
LSTLASFVGTSFGWRAMYAVAAAMMVAIGALLRAILPVSRPVRSEELGDFSFEAAKSLITALIGRDRLR